MSTISRVRYIKDFDGHKFGVMELIYDKGKFGLGMSLCNTKIDKFDRDKGKELAHQRAIECRERNPLLLRDFGNLSIKDIETRSGCVIPMGSSVGDPLFEKVIIVLHSLECITNDMVYTLALSKVKSETA